MPGTGGMPERWERVASRNRRDPLPQQGDASCSGSVAPCPGGVPMKVT